MASGDCSRSLTNLMNIQPEEIQQDAHLTIAHQVPGGGGGTGSSFADIIRALPGSPSLEEAEEEAAKYWDADVIEVDESNRAFIERSIELLHQIRRNSNDCCRRIRQLNSNLPKDQQFYPISTRPRHRKLLIMALESVYKRYQMDGTTSTALRCKQFANPRPNENFAASTMLQIFSLKFAGDFPQDKQPLSVYGFVSVRDDRDYLRNYIFNLSRDKPFDLRPNSLLLPLISPTRGMSVWLEALVEISLKIRRHGSTCEDDDDILTDVCIEFRWKTIKRGKKLKSRIEGSPGALEMEYMFIKRGVEAVLEVDIPMELVGDHVVIIARSTGFQRRELTLYDAVVKAETARVSAVMVASLRGSLYFGYLAVGARASGCTEVQVMKEGSYKGHAVLALVSNVHETRKTTLKIPFTVTFSTMGYHNDGS